MKHIGHNEPPSPIDYAKEVIGELSGWMANEAPVIQTEDQSRHAKLLLDRAKAALEDVERERVAKVKPLNDQVTEINGLYKAAHNTDAKKPGTLDRVVLILKQRLQSYLLAEESKRRRIAEEKQAAADAAREAALLAERLEKEAMANAAVGEIGVDVAAVTRTADEAFGAFSKASREAYRADREADNVKLAGGFGRSVSVRTVEVLIVKDACAAIVNMGLTDGVKDAILTAARAYRAATSDLPDGIEATFERKL
jgi:hypothetical protein